MNKQQVWLSAFCAALGGEVACSSEVYRNPHIKDDVRMAAQRADLGVEEFEKRFGPFPIED